MGVDITVTGNRLDASGWGKIFGAWANQGDDEPFSEPEFGPADGTGSQVAHLWRKGSIRGVLFRWQPPEKELEVRLNAFASRRDWMTAFTILRTGVKHGGGTILFEGEDLSPDELSKEEAFRRASHDFLFAAASVARADRDSMLPFGDFSLTVSASEMAGCTPKNLATIENELADRVERYATAYRSGVMNFKTGHRVTTWALIPTIIDKRVDRIDVAVSDPMSYPADTAELSLTTLLELLGDRAEDLHDTYYLPAVQIDEEQELIDAFKSAAAETPAIEETEPQFASQAEAPSGGAVDLTNPESIAGVVTGIVQAVAREEKPEDVHAQLVEWGLDDEMAQALMSGSFVALEALLTGKQPKAVVKILKKKLGVPEEFGMIIVKGVADGLG